MAVLRAACIGCGGRGRLYSGFAARLPELVRMRGYIDARREAADAALAEFGGDYADTDPERVFRDPEVDVVFVCTWHDTHHPYAIAAAKAGKHILIEKPLALAVEDARAIEDEVERAGVTLAIGHKLRWAPVVREVQRRIPEPRVLMGQVMDNRWADDAWYSDPTLGGGNVLSQGCHIVDLLHALAGSDPVQVSAEGGAISHPGSPNVDQAVAAIRYANGAVASVVMGDAGVNPVTSKFFAQVWDGRGNGACLNERCRRADLWGAEPGVLRAEDLGDDAREDPEGDLTLLKAFLEAARSGKTIHPSARDGRITAQTQEAILRSIRTGETQAVESRE